MEEREHESTTPAGDREPEQHREPRGGISGRRLRQTEEVRPDETAQQADGVDKREPHRCHQARHPCHGHRPEQRERACEEEHGDHHESQLEHSGVAHDVPERRGSGAHRADGEQRHLVIHATLQTREEQHAQQRPTPSVPATAPIVKAPVTSRLSMTDGKFRVIATVVTWLTK